MDEATRKLFGRKLRQLRHDANLSQPQLARQIPVSQASLSRYESGNQAVDTATAARLDDLLGAGGVLRLLATGNAAPDVLTPEDAERISRTMDRPRRLDARVVSAFAGVLAAQRRLDDTLGPRLVIPAVMTQLTVVRALVKQSGGPHRAELAEVAAEWVQFAGWLHAEAREDAEALKLLAEAAHAADELDQPVLAAQASNFMGYLSRQQCRPRGVVRWFMAEHHTPGANVHQRIGAAAQAAHGYGTLGDGDSARRLLSTAERLLETAEGEPAPRTAYWLDTNFHRLNLGLAFNALGEHVAAADHLSGGLAGLPTEQQGAAWTQEYRAALGQLR